MGSKAGDAGTGLDAGVGSGLKQRGTWPGLRTAVFLTNRTALVQGERLFRCAQDSGFPGMWDSWGKLGWLVILLGCREIVG